MLLFAAAALALIGLDAMLVVHDEARSRRPLLILSLGVALLLGLACLASRADVALDIPERGFYLYMAIASGLWAGGAALFLLPRCLELFPARLFCGPRCVAGLAALLGVLFRGLARGDWEYVHVNWFFVAHLAVSACALAFGLLVLAAYALFGQSAPPREPPQA